MAVLLAFQSPIETVATSDEKTTHVHRCRMFATCAYKTDGRSL